ncbi:NMDA receptor synaptonuclear signaling and neuronal migration factor-like [Hydractinia symbiolongicarpus]|uniref:NMDA receptor synaptonuclear signaling and neuronal migration factor-like n=1 Tax=Hydractinia symbiolongicarpus TaxID=13093 RepID=UPI00254CBF00|nr:NMDA receptor synaptonuclear signaling and neuronal migration factor-like [Hydractinia symbiolongicarpus]
MGSVVSRRSKRNEARVKAQAVAALSSNNNDKSNENESQGLDNNLKNEQQTEKTMAAVQQKQKNNNINNDMKKTHERNAAIVIQSTFRGHNIRKAVEKEKLAAAKIQREFRVRYKKGKGMKKSSVEKEIPEKNCTEIGDKTKESFANLQDDIDELRWKGEQQKERNWTDNSQYEPLSVVIIASNINKPDVLKKISTATVIVYDFNNTNLNSLLEKIKTKLDNYKEGCKLKSLGIVCKGGPGHFYLLKGVVCTSVKMEKGNLWKDFYQKLGSMCSKLEPVSCSIDLIVDDICKKGSGNALCAAMKKTMYPNRVSVTSAGDLTKDSLLIIEKYFNTKSFVLWKRSRFSKLDFKVE